MSRSAPTPTSSSMPIDSYNSDKVQLQDSITKVYQTLQDRPNQTSQYKDIQDETNRLSYRQEVIYNMVSTLAVIAVFVTIRRHM
jgi:hypothetical protein